MLTGYDVFNHSHVFELSSNMLKYVYGASLMRNVSPKILFQAGDDLLL